MLSEASKNEINSWLSDDPSDGWWHGGEKEYYKLADDLIDKGLTEEDALSILSKACYTVKNEYGE